MRTIFGCLAFGAGGLGGGKGGSGAGGAGGAGGGGLGSGGTLEPEILSAPMIMTAIGAIAQVACFWWYVHATHDELAAQALQHIRAEDTSWRMV